MCYGASTGLGILKNITVLQATLLQHGYEVTFDSGWVDEDNFYNAQTIDRLGELILNVA